jgi:RNA-directed DNA polymerase
VVGRDGLELHPEKTCISHAFEPHNGQVGLDFLGFHIRQYPVGKHRPRTYLGQPGYKTLIKPSRKALQRQRDKLRDIIQHHRGAPLIGPLFLET